MKYVSTRGGVPPTALDDVILNGFAPDGGLYVPQTVPSVDLPTLESWKRLGFVDLAFEVMSLFVPPEVVPAVDLRRLLEASYARFDHPEVAPIVRTREGWHVLELFHGPTLSFKDMAMGFLVLLTDYLLERRGQRKHLVVATTGDTGPAAAAASAGLERVDTWVLYPTGGFVSDEQEAQMTSLAPNVHVAAVSGCKDGGDDLDAVVARLFADADFRRDVNLGSVNSINWGRVCVQTVHYFHAYLRVAERVGVDRVTFAVPTGAFGNLFAGYLAHSMGLPVAALIAATNANAAFHRALTTGEWTRRPLIRTPSTAIDIAVPYNLWRTLYFATGGDADTIRRMQDEYDATGRVAIPPAALSKLRLVFRSAEVSDERTTETIASLASLPGGYLACPHTAVAVAAVTNPGLLHRGASPMEETPGRDPVVVLATAHPCKFGGTIRRALGLKPTDELPPGAMHPTVGPAAAGRFQRRWEGPLDGLEAALRRRVAETTRWRALIGRGEEGTATWKAASSEVGGSPPLDVVPLSTLKAAVSHDVARDAVAAAFIALSRGDVVNPSPMHLGTRASAALQVRGGGTRGASEEGEVHVKAAWIKGSPTFAVKVAAGFYDNPTLYGVPSGSGLLLVCSAATGAPRAVLADEGWLTDMRTAAAGALAARAALPTSSSIPGERLRVAVLGAGVQARMQLEAMRAALDEENAGWVREWEGVKVWSRRPEAAAALVSHLSSHPQSAFNFGAVEAAASVREAVAGAHLIVTATPSRSPLIASPDLIAPGATVVAVGSDGAGKRELAPRVVMAATRVIVDVEAQSRTLGELQGMDTYGVDGRGEVVTLGDVLSGAQPARKGADEIVLVDLTGVGAQDAAIAGAAWEAVRNGRRPARSRL